MCHHRYMRVEVSAVGMNSCTVTWQSNGSFISGWSVRPVLFWKGNTHFCSSLLRIVGGPVAHLMCTCTHTQTHRHTHIYTKHTQQTHTRMNAHLYTQTIHTHTEIYKVEISIDTQLYGCTHKLLSPSYSLHGSLICLCSLPFWDGSTVCTFLLTVKVRWSADRRSMVVLWDKSLHPGECLRSSETEIYKVEISIDSDQLQTPPPPGKTKNSGHWHYNLRNDLHWPSETAHWFLTHSMPVAYPKWCNVWHQKWWCLDWLTEDLLCET